MARAGQFRDRVTVERKSGEDTLDEYGNAAAPAWTEYGIFWADLRETPGKERLAAGRIEAPASATLRLRASAEARAITAEDRVQARGAVWGIVSPPVDPTGRGQLVEFLLERGGAVQ